MKNKLIKVFIIKDDDGKVWGVAPTLAKAKVQAAWFLPKLEGEKKLNYKIDWMFHQHNLA